MKKYMYIWFISLFILGCQSGENKYPSKSLRVLGWTQDDSQIVLRYTNLKRDIPVGASPQPTDFKDSIYLYNTKSKSLEKNFTFPDHSSNNEIFGGFSYHDQTHRIYFEGYNTTAQMTRLYHLDLATRSIASSFTEYPFIPGASVISVSPDNRYAYLAEPDNQVYDFLAQSFKTLNPAPKLANALYWFEKDEKLHFLAVDGVYRLSPDIEHLAKTHSIEWPTGPVGFHFVGLKNDHTLYYVDDRSGDDQTLIERDLNQDTVVRSNIQIDSDISPSPPQLSHDKTQFAYLENSQLTILNLSNQNKRTVLSFKDFPDGGLITAPSVPVDSIF